MNKVQKKRLYKIIIASVLFICGIALPLPHKLYFALLLAAYLIVGTEIIRKSLRNIANGRIFDENLLMTIATIAAFCIHQYPEAVAVMLFFQIGEFFQSLAVNRSRQAISKLMDIRPTFANLLKNGKIKTVCPEDIKIGDTIVIRAGEKIPLDAIVSKGNSSIDTSSLTGEPIPQDVGPKSKIISGCINLSGTIYAKVTSIYQESTVAKILNLVENAATQKSKTENLITRFARYYTPCVVVLALALATLPPLFGYLDWQTWVYRAITFLVISCPCALVISVPLSFFGGIGSASRQGILIKGSCFLEALAQIKCIIFDKTGTLTLGNFVVQKICPQNGFSQAQLIKAAAYAEAHSPHPIAQSIKHKYAKKIISSDIISNKVLPGLGVKTVIKNQTVYVGNLKLMQELGFNIKTPDNATTLGYVVIDNQYAGYLEIADKPRPEAKHALAELQKLGINKTGIFSGDRQTTVSKLAKKLGINIACGELLPADKISHLEQCLCQYKTAFVGDGINDTPSLARADVGIAMGGIGTDAAIEAADVIIMDDNLNKLPSAIKIARHTINIAKQNIAFAIGIKFLVLGLGAFGFASIWAAVFADVGVTLIAILNALRA